MSPNATRPYLLARARLETVAKYVRGAGLVIADQVLISASNFAGMVIAARVLSTNDFGAYALAYTGLWALNGLQSSLITQPYSVLAAGRSQADYRRYTSAIGRMQIALSAGLGIPIMVVGLVILRVGGGAALLAVGLALVAWQAQEFLRRVLLVEGRVAAVVVVDSLSFGGQVLVILGLTAVGHLTVATGLVAAAMTSAAAALVGVILLRDTLFHSPLPGAITENVAHGRWLLGAEVGAFICLSSYPFLLAILRGSHDVAIYAAAMLVLNPLNVIWFAVGSTLPVKMSRSRATRGEAAARAELRTAYLVTTPAIAAYCLVAAVLAGPILGFVFGDAFAGSGWVVAVAALTRLFAYHSHLLSLGLRAFHQTRWIFFGYSAAVPFSLVAGTILISLLGILGAIVAMLGSSAIWTGIWARAYLRLRQ